MWTVIILLLHLKVKSLPWENRNYPVCLCVLVQVCGTTLGSFVCKSSCPCVLAYVKRVCTSVPLSSRTAVTCMRIHCGWFTLFFHQPASLLTSYIPSIPSSSLRSLRLTTSSWADQWESLVCGLDTGCIVPVCHQAHTQTHTNILTNMTTSHWAAAVCLAHIGDLTATVATGVKSVFAC